MLHTYVSGGMLEEASFDPSRGLSLQKNESFSLRLLVVKADDDDGS